MSGDSTVTAHKTVAVRLSLGAWLQVIGGVVSVLVAWTVIGVRYLDQRDARIDKAQTSADSAQKSADLAAAKADSIQSSFNTTILQISGDVREIKGQLTQMSRDSHQTK
jgi:hypothetical protein